MQVDKLLLNIPYVSLINDEAREKWFENSRMVNDLNSFKNRQQY